MSQNSQKRNWSRRDFLRTAAIGAAAPAIVPASVLGRARSTPPAGNGAIPNTDRGTRRRAGRAPSDILAIGCIGVGRQGQGDMQELIYRGLEAGARVTAVCDVDLHRMQDAQWLTDAIYAKELDEASRPGGCAAFRDYRELLARPDIDGVLIVTPDHWHAAHAIDAAAAGKDIYLEKPLTYTISEGRRLVDAVRRHKRLLQVGSQQRSSVYFHMACELVRNGRIGRLRTMRVRLPIDQGGGDPAPQPTPRSLDYDFWLGPAAEAPFCEDRVHPQRSYDRPGWLQIEAYSRGMITGWGSHMIDTAQWGHGSDDSGPVEIEAKGEFPDRGLFDVHTTFQGEAVYADGVRMILESGDPAGVRFEGDRDWIFVQRGKIEASRPEILKEKAGEGETRLYKSANHMKDFLECLRTRKDPVAPVEGGHRSNTICVLTHIAMKLGRRLRWDPRAERFPGDDEANARLDYEYRKKWGARL